MKNKINIDGYLNSMEKKTVRTMQDYRTLEVLAVIAESQAGKELGKSGVELSSAMQRQAELLKQLGVRVNSEQRKRALKLLGYGQRK